MGLGAQGGEWDKGKVQRNPILLPQHLMGERGTNYSRLSSGTPEALHLTPPVRFHRRQRRMLLVLPEVTTYGPKLTISFQMTLNST